MKLKALKLNNKRMQRRTKVCINKSAEKVKHVESKHGEQQ
jgi:hypothetical protein